MQYKRKKDNSIKKKLLLPIIIVMLFQAVIFAVAILYGGTIEGINSNSFDILNGRVVGRKNYIQNEMIQRWSQIDSFEGMVTDLANSTTANKKLTISDIKINKDLANEIINNMANEMIYMLRKNSVTGIFIILDSQSRNELVEDSINRPGLYIRDLNPSSNPKDNSDLLIERGSSVISKEHNITMDTHWSPQVIFERNGKLEQYDFYNKPFDAANVYDSEKYSDYGYWSAPFQLSEYDMEVITYSVPLIGDDGTVYGVIGVEISLDYLRKMIPSDEIDFNGKGAYVIGIGTNDDSEFKKVIHSGSIYTKLFGDKQEIDLIEKPVYDNIFAFKDDYQGETVYANVQHFKLYNSNTPFENEKWMIAGVVEEGTMFIFSNKLKKTIGICFTISIVVGIIGVLIAGTLFTKPIQLLVEKVKESNPQKKVKFDKTNILEIDELALAIEILSNDVADSASKLSKIMDMVNLPIGAFEYYLNSNRVFCTEQFFEVMGLEKDNEYSQYISRDIFEKIIYKMYDNSKRESESVYNFKTDSGIEKWIKIKEVEDNTKMIGVVIDATEETLEKQKIEHERDYDLLTNLLNRRAFHCKMSKLFKEKYNLNIAAIIMWDLDNLKYVNDTYGHDCGDKYIMKAAEVLKFFMPHNNAVVSRMSGDEFYVFLYGYSNKDEIRNIIDKVKNIMDKSTIELLGSVLKIRASGGIAWYPDDAIDYKQLIKFSDFAMYKVKNTVKGEISEFNKDEYERDAFLLDSNEELNRLVEEELLDYVFQPIVNSKDGSIFGYETLMRPQLESLKSPLDVLRIAQFQSKLYQIEKLTWFKSLEAYSNQVELFGNAKLFINSISNHILSDKDIKDLENKYSMYLDKVVIELTETEQMRIDITKRKEKLAEKWNGLLAVDDYGSGYNSESLLLSVYPEFVKIDMEFVTGINNDIEKQEILQNMLVYLKSKGIKVIAEGIENKYEMEILVEYGVDYMQGYYFGKGELSPQKISDEVLKSLKEVNLKTQQLKGEIK